MILIGSLVGLGWCSTYYPIIKGLRDYSGISFFTILSIFFGVCMGMGKYNDFI